MTLVQEVTEQHARELWAIRKTEWSTEEYRLLAHRFVDAAKLMKIAIENENFAGLQMASFDLAELVDQAAFLNAGLQKAIGEAVNPYKGYRR